MIQTTHTMPSGIPSRIPTDPDGKTVALQYYWPSSTFSPMPLAYYHEDLIRPSGVLYGVTGTEYSNSVNNLGQFTEAVLCLDVHAMTRDDSDESLNVFVETSFDSGQNWRRIAGFETVETTGTQDQTIQIAASGTQSSRIYKDMTSTSNASGCIVLGAFGDRMRVASEFNDPAGADSSGIFSVYGSWKR